MSFVDIVRSEFPLKSHEVPEIMKMIWDEMQNTRKMMRFDRANKLEGSLWHDSLYMQELEHLKQEIENMSYDENPMCENCGSEEISRIDIIINPDMSKESAWPRFKRYVCRTCWDSMTQDEQKLFVEHWESEGYEIIE